ncbi:RsmB/NOP family class I SAM-dependent RNA methyltransferase [Thalassococcus sp. S3]|uniref:RsmB/NOP family class I SAM-dependent RNA methyltransferase n=1 Tax=Thalassococcus sp. S3 TaxID=2017482 RepID=UPI0010248C4B|nr:transcription antitermination factor NusB [Thalassococcus sp. S3]QBF33747.1 16S rRNA methyltransferase [Thalassococcus sp. S3]
MQDKGIGARRGAVSLLDQVLGQDRLLSEALNAGVLTQLQPDDRARAQRLATETLRNLERADRLLQKHLRKPPPLTIRNALRVGTFELCTGGAAHGVVNAFVELTANNRRQAHLKGLVNAVLRKVAATGPDVWSKLRISRLPIWLRRPLVEAWGADAVASMERAHAAGAPLDLTPKGEIGDLADRLGADVLPTGSLRLREAGQISRLPGYAEGDWWVQDAAAALPVKILAPKAGEKVVDLCAAPGGKTMQLAAASARVTAIDSSETRMARVSENLKRTGLDADLIIADALEHGGAYDAVLLDAPCSATGTIRRHPDLPFAKDGGDFAGLIALQGQLIDHAWSLLKPGGRMVFCTCSIFPDEGEVQIEEALIRHRDMSADRAAYDLNGIDRAWQTEEGGLRLRPDFWLQHGGMDGFYIAFLRKATTASVSSVT